MNDFICSIAMALLSSGTQTWLPFSCIIWRVARWFFFHVSKLFFWLIRDLIEVSSCSNLKADHFNPAKIDLCDTSKWFFSFILKTCEQNARVFLYPTFVYMNVWCLFLHILHDSGCSFLWKFCARNWYAASHKYRPPNKCHSFECSVTSFTPINTRSPPIQPQFTLTHLYPFKCTSNYHKWVWFWQTRHSTPQSILFIFNPI